jgi:hypothetical protein
MAIVLWVRRLPHLSHPLVWFTPLYMLYSASFPALALLGIYAYDEAVQRTVVLHALALFMFATPLVWHVFPYPPERPLTSKERVIRPITASLLTAGLPLAMLLLLGAASLGLSSKRELVDSGNPVVALAIAALNGLFVVGVVLVARINLSRRAVWAIGVLASLAVLAIGTLGERDYLLRLAVCLVLLAWDLKRKPSLGTAALAGAALFALLPMLQALKAVFLGGGFSYTFAAVDLIGQEFRVMAQNTWMVLSSNATDLLSPAEAAVMEGGRILGVGRSLAAWFNDVIVGTGEQRGFSMVAAAYMMGGVAGVAVAYFLVGLSFRLLYAARRRSLCWLAGFVLAAPALVYAQRADFSNFIAPLLKWVGLPLLLIAAMSELSVIRSVQRRDTTDSVSLAERG